MNRAVIEQIKNPYIGIYIANMFNLGNPSVDEIVNAVISVTKIPKERLMSNFGRHHDAVLARGICYILIRKQMPNTKSETTISDYVLYFAKRLLDAESKYTTLPTNKTERLLERRRKEFNEAISKLSIKQGNLFNNK